MKLKGGPTQDEIMAVSIHKLRLGNGETFVDMGCGTGKIAVAAAATACKVYAVDRRPEAIAFAREEADRAGAGNIEFFEGEGEEFLQTVDQLDCAFVGGSKNLEKVLTLLAAKTRGKIVVNAVMLETVQTAVSTMKRLGIFEEVVHVQVSRSSDIAEGLMLKPLNPVFIIVGGK